MLNNFFDFIFNIDQTQYILQNSPKDDIVIGFI